MSQRKISGILLVCLLVFGLPAMAQDDVTDEMIEQAERDGSIQPGGTIIEPTSGGA